MSEPRELTQVAVYRRTIRASLDRIWENVLDWEHLPWLHRDSFSEITLQEAGDWGWRATAVTTQGASLGIELRVDWDDSRYVSRTLSGQGAGTEIWTGLRSRAAHETDIEVAFLLPNVPESAVARLAAGFTSLYAKLWDEDEEMMRERELRLVARRAAPAADAGVVLALGPLEALCARLPLKLDFAGEPFWLVELEGALLAHSAVCPHSLGPLAAATERAGSVEPLECRWHGYRFDARTGASCDARKLRMRAAPKVVIENGEVRLVAPQRNLARTSSAN